MKKALIESGGIHLFIVLAVAGLFYFKPISSKKNTEVIVVEPIVTPSALALKPPFETPRPTSPPPEQKKKVFGVTRNTLTSDSEGALAGVKTGNTLAKEADNLKLDKNDPDSLPIPADEFLISKMPERLSLADPPYPSAAEIRGVEGRVVVSLLIDKTGTVRDAKLVQSRDPELDQAAVDFAKTMRFRPAEQNGEAVAVRVNFTYNFKIRR